MENFVVGDLTITVDRSDPLAIKLSWLGKSNSRSPSKELGPLFVALANEATAQDRRIEMRFEHIEHFNSSTITALIQFIQGLDLSKVALRLVYDGSLKWQRLSVEALRVFERAGGSLEIHALEAA